MFVTPKYLDFCTCKCFFISRSITLESSNVFDIISSQFIDEFINNFLPERHIRWAIIDVYDVFDPFVKRSCVFSKSKRLDIYKVHSYQAYQMIFTNIN